MKNNIPSYFQLMQSWSNLWQAGFATMWQGYEQWARSVGAYQLGQDQVGQTPADVVWQYGRIRLLHYKPTTKSQSVVPLLCIPSLINRYYILDLIPERSMVKYLVNRGLNVYMLDWGRPSAADAEVTFDQHITEYIHKTVEFVQTANNVSQVSLLGYCMGGMFSTVYTSLFGKQVANLVNLAGPINFHDDGIFSLMTSGDWFDVDRLVDTYGNIPADMLLWTFNMIRPTANMLRALYLYERMEDEHYVRNFAAMQTWILDQVDFPGETFRRYVKALYQDNKLIKNELTIDDKSVDLGKITTPLLNITSKQDETAPWKSVVVLNEMVNSEDKELLMLKGPHVGMVAGRSAPKHFWPELADWLIHRSEHRSN